MLGLLIIFVSLAIGFTAGYVMGGTMSRKRRAEYLKYEPYISPSLRAKSPASLVQPHEGNRMQGVASAPTTISFANVEGRRTNLDTPHSFQDVYMNGAKPAGKDTRRAGANLLLVDSHPKQPQTSPSRPVTVEESLEELVARLQRSRRER
jgi:hypothetical protein